MSGRRADNQEVRPRSRGCSSVSSKSERSKECSRFAFVQNGRESISRGGRSSSSASSRPSHPFERAASGGCGRCSSGAGDHPLTGGAQVPHRERLCTAPARRSSISRRVKIAVSEESQTCPDERKNAPLVNRRGVMLGERRDLSRGRPRRDSCSPRRCRGSCRGRRCGRERR